MRKLTNQDIYEIVKSEIINLTILPGSKLKEEDLALRFNVSRTPIRAIISQLENDNLVYVIPKKGTFVSKIDFRYLEAQSYIRKAVEIQVLSDLIKVITPKDIEILESILLDQKEIIEKEPSVEKSRDFYENDNLFHKTLFTLLDKEEVWNQLNKEQPNLNRLRIVANMRQNDLVKQVYNEHVNMLEALKTKDVYKLVQAFVNHLDNGFIDISTIENKYKEFIVC